MFLHERLNVSKMYKLYCIWCREENINPMAEHMYRQVFYLDFNLSLFKRKKDKCMTCNAFENCHITASPSD